MGNLLNPITYLGTKIIYTDNKGIKHSENVMIQANQTFYIGNLEFRISNNKNQKGQLKVREHYSVKDNEWQNTNALQLNKSQFSVFNHLSNLVDENNGIKTLSILDTNKNRKIHNQKN